MKITQELLDRLTEEATKNAFALVKAAAKLHIFWKNTPFLFGFLSAFYYFCTQN